MTDQEFGSILIGKLLNIGGMLQRSANQMLQPSGLNQHQYSILFEINKAGRVTQSKMINRMALEKAHMSKVIKKLAGMGLIEITPSPEDKRSSWISATPKGREIVKSCQELFKEWYKGWLDEVAPERRGEMLDDLSLLQTVFKSCI